MLVAFEATIVSVFSFITISILLGVYGVLDIRNRKVSNEHILVGFLVSAVIVVGTGRMFEQTILHVASILVMILLSSVLFRIGAIGGADAKALLLVGFLSPGLEFAVWGDIILEGILISGLEIALMLVFGILYWQAKVTGHWERNGVPLIPFLFLAYLIVQLLAFL
ncbi:hypothetical protein EU522_00305 [Candidatus Thorarchaeota archaeon]|nr:MAG: hypothetical protein EU522_00305 [Candidatus Thorarchaeota archaeon]